MYFCILDIVILFMIWTFCLQSHKWSDKKKSEKQINVRMIWQLISLKSCWNSQILKFHLSKKLWKLLMINFKSLVSRILEVIRACLVFLRLPVTIATAERRFSEQKSTGKFLTFFLGTKNAIGLIYSIIGNRKTP